MSHVFVQYSGHKDEVANTLGIATEVHYDFEKLETFVVSVPTASLEVLHNDPNILRVEVEEDHPIYPIGMNKVTTGGPDDYLRELRIAIILSDSSLRH